MDEPTPYQRRRTDIEPPHPPALRALVVDDSDSYRPYVAQIVARNGFAVLSCNDGDEAVGLLTQGTTPFDLLVIDCEMPRLNGLDLIQQLRKSDRYADTFAVMLTGRDDTETKLAALRLGFDDFILKSSGEPEIVAKLNAARRIVLRQRKLDAAVRELYGLATRDELTGLFNRRHLFTEAERLLEESTTLSFVFFDLDDFKAVNDNMGHLAGDRILRDVGALFLRRTRHQDLVARYGGDEFIMLVTDLEAEGVEQIAARITEEIEAAQWTFGHETLRIGVTTGYACSSLLQRPTVRQLVSAGDRDLYKNKWMRAHPDEDPSLYEYDSKRDAHVVEISEIASLEPFRVRRSD